MRFFFLLFFPVSLVAFVTDPWFSKIAEFEFRPSYTYRYYPSIDRGTNPFNYHSHDHLVDMNLGLRFLPNWEAQLEVDFSNTRCLSWGTQRVGSQVRYLIFDDIVGDPISLVFGGQVFYVPIRNMRDVSSPYHAPGNLEFGIAIGKEINQIYQWLYRFYGFLGLGIGNKGYPWVRPFVSAEMKYARHHKFQLFSEGYMGLGGKGKVNVDRFNGYGKIQHRSIDLSFNYTYLFQIWGGLGIQYTYRIYAHAFPQYTNIFKVEYSLPFSLF